MAATATNTASAGSLGVIASIGGFRGAASPATEGNEAGRCEAMRWVLPPPLGGSVKDGGGRAAAAAFEHDADEVFQDAPLSLILEADDDRSAT